MENELTCSVCNDFYKNPVVLPCSHNLCYLCAKKSITSANPENQSDGASDDSGYLSIGDFQQICLNNNRGNLNLPFPQFILTCSRCTQSYGLDERGVDSLPRNLILDGLVKRYQAKSNEIDCQLCENDPATKAQWMCEQCQVAYCEKCLKIYHPKRGPLAKHSLVPPNPANVAQSSSKSRQMLKCIEHDDENISMYCTNCKCPVCYLCFENGRHTGHEAKALGLMFKEQKSELAKSVKNLGDKNKELQNFLHSLQESISKVAENGIEFEAQIVAKFDSLSKLIEEKKSKLLECVGNHVKLKNDSLKEQSAICMEKLKNTTGLLQYTFEVLKENDPASFLLVANSLNNRLSHSVKGWLDKNNSKPVTGPDVELTLDTSPIINALGNMHFTELKGPGVPEIIPEECSVTNNNIVLSWRMTDRSSPDGYIIEIDDGLGGDFDIVHETDKLFCSLGGLQFHSTYRARVRAFNRAGEGIPSEVVYLTTPDVAVFCLDTVSAHPDIRIAEDNFSMTCSSFENRVVLGDVGFSRGRHYWEVSVEKYEGNPDPAFGVALENVAKDFILGRDEKAWSVYVDSNRSWFQHSNEHLFRSEGGIAAGSTVGLLLDLEENTLTFYCNGEKRGPVPFPSLASADVVFPAFSLNRNVAMTLQTGIEPPDGN